MRKHYRRMERGYVDDDKVEMYDFENGWTEEISEYKRQRVIKLRQDISETEKMINQAREDPEGHTERFFMVSTLYLEEQLMDLREDELLLKYEGKIPKVVKERDQKKCEATYNRYRKMWGAKNLQLVKDDVDVYLRGDVIVDNYTTGGGKV